VDEFWDLRVERRSQIAESGFVDDCLEDPAVVEAAEVHPELRHLSHNNRLHSRRPDLGDWVKIVEDLAAVQRAFENARTERLSETDATSRSRSCILRI
jgi:hypothetical protein